MKVQLVAITGGSGSGKSWFTHQVAGDLSADAAVLTMDDFYRDLSHLPVPERDRTNFDHPDAIDWGVFRECLWRIKSGEAPTLPNYDFATHTRSLEARRWLPSPMVLIEGLWLLHDPALRQLYNLSIFLDCPEQLRLQRRLERDQRERSRTRRSILHQFRTQVGPMHLQFVQPQKEWADLVIPPGDEQEAVTALATSLRPKQDAGDPTSLESRWPSLAAAWHVAHQASHAMSC